MTLDSELLRAFVSVADTGNVTRAAGRLGRTQSAVSMQIKRLEQIVGEPLFARGSRGVQLTRKGEDLLPNARRVMLALEETVASLRVAQLDGPVRIGIPEEYGKAIVARALRRFSALHPKVEITVRFATSALQVAAIDAGELDLAVVFEWKDESDGETLMSDPTVWAESVQLPRHAERPLPIAIYRNSEWCRDFALRSLKRHGIDHRIAYVSDTSGGMLLAATSGLAVAPLARSNIPAGCRELTVADGFGPIDAARVVLRRNPAAAGAAVNGMAEAIREAFRARSGPA